MLVSTTGATGRNTAGMGSGQLLDVLRDYVEQAADGDAPSSAGANVAELDDSRDPMNEVECAVQKDVTIAGSGHCAASRGDGAKRSRYYKNHARNRLLDLYVPSQLPEVV